MRAAWCREYGPPENVTLSEVPPPVIGAGQVRVRVDAAAVNFPDVLHVAGRYQVQVPPPFAPGSEFAGSVVEIAPDTAGGESGLAVGDRVFGSTMVGAFAEEVVLAARSLTRIPGGVSASMAAAFGVAHRTAYHVLRSVAAVRPGDEVVVLGAGGGVGLAAVRLATVLGARVTAVASSAAKLQAAADQGAINLIEHPTGDVRAALKECVPGGVDVVVDPVGGPLSEASLRAMRSGGRFVTVGYASGEIPRIPLNLVLLKGVQIVGFQFIDFATHRAAEMQRNDAEVLDHLAAGRATPHIGATFPLADAAAALRHVADGQAIGKVLLTIG